MEVGVIACSLEGSDSAQVNLHLSSLCLLHHTLYALYDLACHGLAAAALGSADVVDALKDNHLLNAALSQDVSVESFFG